MITPQPKQRSPFSVERYLANLSIPRKLGMMISILAFAVCGLFVINNFGMEILSSVRAYTGGEGLWSKAQKQAVLQLGRYAWSHEEEDFQAYRAALAVPLGDHQARLELEKPNLDFQAAYQGFLRGGNHPADIPGMIHLFRWFGRISYMDRAIRIWRQGDGDIAELQDVGDHVHRLMTSDHGSLLALQKCLAHAQIINIRLAPLENDFSSTLGDAARWFTHLLLVSTAFVTLLLLGLGLFTAFYIGRHLTGQIDRLRHAAIRVAEGDFTRPVKTETKDEIGDLSRVFGNMAMQLEQRITELGAANKELEGFCYSISHDLRAPLRAIDGFSGILAEDHTRQLDAEGQRLLQVIRRNVAQMSELIDGLLSFSRLSLRPLETREVDMTGLVESITNELQASDPRRVVAVQMHPLHSAKGDPTLLRQVWINLLSNAFKFTRHQSAAQIIIDGHETADQFVYSVKDNGAGFDMQFRDKLFGVFQRLHSLEEFEGTGVGLALVRRIVVRHGGVVWAEAEVGKGATFYFSLPKEQSQVPHSWRPGPGGND